MVDVVGVVVADNSFLNPDSCACSSDVAGFKLGIEVWNQTYSNQFNGNWRNPLSNKRDQNQNYDRNHNRTISWVCSLLLALDISTLAAKEHLVTIKQRTNNTQQTINDEQKIQNKQ